MPRNTLVNFSGISTLKSKLDQEIERLTVKISATDVKGSDETDLIEFGFYFLANLDKLFTVADLDVKRTIIGSTFPEKLIYEKNAYRTASDENILLLGSSRKVGG